MHHTRAYPCHVCNHNASLSLIFTMHHRVHAHNSYLCTPPWGKRSWLRFTQGKMFAWVIERECTKLWWCKYSEFYWKLDLSPTHTFRNSNDAWSEIQVNTSEDADNAITMHNVCKDNVKHHLGTLWHDKGQSIIEWECKVPRGCRDRTSH